MRRRRPVSLALGILLLVGGLVASVIGIIDVMGSGSGISENAVARGRLTDETQPLTFSGEPGTDYSIYLAFGGIVSDEQEQDATVGDTVCEVRHPDGATSEIRGDRQAASVSLGTDATIGWFTASQVAGDTTVLCAFERGSTRTRRVRDDGVEVLVTPGSPTDSLLGFGLLFGGLSAAGLGGFLLFRGIRGKRVPLP